MGPGDEHEAAVDRKYLTSIEPDAHVALVVLACVRHVHLPIALASVPSLAHGSNMRLRHYLEQVWTPRTEVYGVVRSEHAIVEREIGPERENFLKVDVPRRGVGDPFPHHDNIRPTAPSIMLRLLIYQLEERGARAVGVYVREEHQILAALV